MSPAFRLPSAHILVADNLNVRYWSNRAAHLAAVQIPLLPALAAKNNIIGCEYALPPLDDLHVDTS
jgi:hypothetical protein